MNKNKEDPTMWDREATNIYCDLCLREVELGNKLTTYFNKEGWQNLTTKFKEITERDYDRMKFKNKRDQLKKNWKIWKELKRRSTRLGWDPLKRIIDAPEEWWAEKQCQRQKKFKLTGIKQVLEEKLNGMFTGIVATGAHVFSPNEQGFASLAQDMDIEHIGDSGQVPSQIHIDVQSTTV